MLRGIFATVKALLGLGDTVRSISQNIADAKIAAIKAGTDKEKFAREAEVKMLEARAMVLATESTNGGKLNQFVRAALAWPIVVVFWKYFIWDYALHEWTQGVSPALSTDMWWVIGAVVGFYFLSEAIRR